MNRVVAVRRYVPNFLSIKARQIEAWAEYHLDARQLLPVLLRRLVHSTGHDLRRVDFPGYDNAERKGSDGIIESEAATAWIPGGKSYWEFGVNKNPQAKAEKDYAARVPSVPAAERPQSTFVFVTPRNWPGKEAWLKEKIALNEWKAVRVRLARLERTPPHHERLQRVRGGAHGVRRTCGSNAGADFDRALSRTARRGSAIDDRSGIEDIRRHAETVAGIVVEIYLEYCRFPE